MPLAQGDKWRHTKVSALISILKGSPANAAELISRPRAHNCAFPGGAECEIVSLRSLASLRLLSFFLPRREFVFRCFLPSSRRAAAFLHLGAFRAFTAGCEYTACAAVFCICLFFFAYVFFHLLRSTFSLSISLRRPFHHRGDLQGGGDGAAQQSEENRQALHSGQSKCVWVCERAASNGR